MSRPSGGPWGPLPLALLRSEEYQQLPKLAQLVVMVVVARQSANGRWTFSAGSLAKDTSASREGVRKAVRQAAQAGILIKEPAILANGGDNGWNLTVPLARGLVGRATEGHPPVPERPTPTYIETEHHTEPPNPPPASRRGARTHRAPRRVTDAELGPVDLSRVPDPKLRRRDERKLQALREHDAAVKQSEADAAERRAAVDAVLGGPRERMDTLLHRLRDATDGSAPEGEALDTLEEGRSLRWALDECHSDDAARLRDEALRWCGRAERVVVVAEAARDEARALRAEIEALRMTARTRLAESKAHAGTALRGCPPRDRSGPLYLLWKAYGERAAVRDRRTLDIEDAGDLASAREACEALFAACDEADRAASALLAARQGTTPPAG